MLDTQISKHTVLALIYETYHIAPINEIPIECFTVEGIECLVNDKAIPREIATLIYKILTTNGEDK